MCPQFIHNQASQMQQFHLKSPQALKLAQFYSYALRQQPQVVFCLAITLNHLLPFKAEKVLLQMQRDASWIESPLQEIELLTMLIICCCMFESTSSPKTAVPWPPETSVPGTQIVMRAQVKPYLPTFFSHTHLFSTKQPVIPISVTFLSQTKVFQNQQPSFMPNDTYLAILLMSVLLYCASASPTSFLILAISASVTLPLSSRTITDWSISGLDSNSRKLQQSGITATIRMKISTLECIC